MFDVPQETGNHENTKFVRVFDSEQNGLSIIGCDEFCFSYHDFSLNNLGNALHKNEISRRDSNYLYIDYKVRGLGSRSCGPEPEEAFELRPHSFEFGFALSRLQSRDDIMNLVHCDLGIKTQRLSDTYRFDEVQRIKQIANCAEE